jgi:hypothetical protein
MSDLPVSLLTQQSHASPKSGEELELLGKTAASRYMTTGTPLTQAVIETVKHAGLSPEQVRRVAEFANHEAFQRTFDKLGGDHRYVEFAGGPADVPTILRDLNGGGGGTVFDRGLADYHQPPPDLAKVASRNLDRLGAEDTKLAELFRVKEHQLPYAEPYQESYDLYRRIADTQDKVASELSRLETEFAMVNIELFNQVKQAAIAGIALGHIVQAFSTITDDPEMVKAAFIMLTPPLLSERVFADRLSISQSLEKVAHGAVVDEKHPLVDTFRLFCEDIEKMAALRLTRDELLEGRNTLGTFLREIMAKEAAGDVGGELVQHAERGAHALRQGWNTATRAADAASGPAGRIGEALIGPLAGKALGTAVKYAPHIGAGLLAEEAYQHARYNPAFQGAKNLVLSRIPYTHPYMVRQYDLQMGG